MAAAVVARVVARVVAHREVSREFVQGALVPSVVADALMPLLDEQSGVRAHAVDGLHEVCGMLGTAGASGRVALMIRELVAATPP